MQAEDRKDFEAHMEALFGAFDRTITGGRLDGYFKGLEKMSLADFVRCKDAVLAKLETQSAEHAKPPSVNQLWTVKRSLRARAPASAAPEAAKWQGDSWDVFAGNRLLKFIMRHAHQLSSDAMRTGRIKPSNPSEEDLEYSRAYVGYKRAWAQDMREWNGAPTKAEQDEAWRECMERLLADAKRIREKYALKVAA